MERHLFAGDSELMSELFTLVRLFPPESVLPDADTFRTLPGTVLRLSASRTVTGRLP